MIELFSDGCSLGNPGKSGCSFIIKKDGDVINSHAEGYELSTNSRMELLGMILGLESIDKTSTITAYSDSEYIIKTFTENRLEKWIAAGWKRADKKPIANKDLWVRLVKMNDKHNITYKWIKGHAGHEENELCDKMANNAARASYDKLKKDHQYLARS